MSVSKKHMEMAAQFVGQMGASVEQAGAFKLAIALFKEFSPGFDIARFTKRVLEWQTGERSKRQHMGREPGNA